MIGDEQRRAPAEPSAEETAASRRWRVGLLAALAAGSAGVLLGQTAVFVAAIVGLVYSAYASRSTPPTMSLAVDRTLSPESPKPGDRVTVSLRVENVGDAVLPDVRVADEPPADLRVVDGETRGTATLEPGESLTLTYALTARRGRHEFGAVSAIGYTASGAAARRVAYDLPRSLTCYSEVESLDLAPETVPAAGRVETDAGGEGVEFYATREHQASDPMRRVDWNRFARTGELTTIEFRETGAAEVVFLVDSRHRVRRRRGEPDAVELCGYATVRLAEALLDANDLVGAAAFDDGSSYSSVIGLWGFVRPGTGEEQSLRIREMLRTRIGVTVDDVGLATRSVTSETGSTDASASGRGRGGPGDRRGAGRTDGGRMRIDWLRRRLPDGAQVILVSPLLDDPPVSLARRLAAHGHAVTVISPDVTHVDSTGGVVERVERARRVRDLRTGRDARVADWSIDDPLRTAVSREAAGWDR